MLNGIYAGSFEFCNRFFNQSSFQLIIVWEIWLFVGNILLLPNDPEDKTDKNAASVSLCAIDYEYSQYNYRYKC